MVHDEVEPHPRGVAVVGAHPERRRVEAVPVGRLPEQRLRLVFRLRVRVQRLRLRLLVDVGRRGPPVDVTRGGEHDVVDAEFPRRPQDVLRPVVVDTARLGRAVVGAVRAGDRREVDHRVTPPGSRLHVAVLGHVTAAEGERVVVAETAPEEIPR